MYELDVVSLRGTLVKGVRMIVAVRRLAKDVGLDGPELEDLEREVRERVGAVLNVEMELERKNPVGFKMG